MRKSSSILLRSQALEYVTSTHCQATEGISAEEMQEELLDKAAKLKQKEREISVLKMMLDEEKFQHTVEIAKLRTQLASREAESATFKGPREIREGQKIVKLKENIQQLRRQNTALSEEIFKLCSRIDNLETVT
jgi:hypothetical protein